nr:hypothetical protein [Tanacetum cinerariifolium]
MYSTILDFAKINTVNEDVQIQALIDGKKIIVTEASIRVIFNYKMLKVLDSEKAKTAQAKEIAALKKKDKDSLGDQEDASKQGRMIDNIDQDKEIALVNETQGRMNKEEMFGVNDLDGGKVIVDVTAGENVDQSIKVIKKDVSNADPVTTAHEVATTVEDVKVTTAATTP